MPALLVDSMHYLAILLKKRLLCAYVHWKKQWMISVKVTLEETRNNLFLVLGKILLLATNYLPRGELLPRPPPEGLPVVLGPFGGVLLAACTLVNFNIVITPLN